jgi:hypothetical protein
MHAHPDQKLTGDGYEVTCQQVLEYSGAINIAAVWEMRTRRVACIVVVYPTMGVDEQCIQKLKEWVPQQRTTFGSGSGEMEEDAPEEGTLGIAQASYEGVPRARPKGWPLHIILRVLGPGFPTDPQEQDKEILRLQDSTIEGLGELGIVAWARDKADKMSMTPLMQNALDATQFHLGTEEKFEAALPIKATRCGEMPSVRRDAEEMGVWLNVSLLPAGGGTPVMTRLKISGGWDAQVEMRYAHACMGRLVRDHSPRDPCPGRMYGRVEAKMREHDGSKAVFRDLIQRLCEECETDGGPGAQTVCPMAVAYTANRYFEQPGQGTWRPCGDGNGCEGRLMCGGLIPAIDRVVTPEIKAQLVTVYEENVKRVHAAALRRKEADEAAARVALGSGVAATVQPACALSWRGSLSRHARTAQPGPPRSMRKIATITRAATLIEPAMYQEYAAMM